MRKHKKSGISVDPRIQIKLVGDGEVHILFSPSLDQLAELAQAFVWVTEGKLQVGEAQLAFRLRSREGIDYLIDQLTQARNKLFKA